MFFAPKTRVCAFAAALSCVVFSGLEAQDAPQPRVFNTIVVDGNKRFTAQDIVATTGLQTGVLIGEPELMAAVESLQFTGEFEEVVITSANTTLIIQVEEEPVYSGGLTFGVGYDTDDGVFGTVGVSINNAFDKGVAIDGRIRAAEQSQSLTFSVQSENFWAQGRPGGVRFAVENYDYDNTTYDYTFASIEPFVTFMTSERSLVELRYTLAWKDVYGINSLASPIIFAERGDELLSGLGFSYVIVSSAKPDALSPSAWTLRFDQDFTGLGGDAAYSDSRLTLNARQKLTPSGFAVRTTVEFGASLGLGSDNPRVSERFSLGGANLRGFERSTISPRDICLGCAPGGGNLVTILGGNYYAVARTDLLVPIFKQQPQLETFAFFDVGSVWDVQTNTPPAGLLDDGADIRMSYGIGTSFDTGLGKFEAYLALGTEGEVFDERQEFGVSFRAQF